jgi:hypothetical protein
VASQPGAVGGEAEVVVEMGRRTMTMMSPRMMEMGQKHKSLWPLTLRLWEVRLRLWLKTGREENNDDDEPEDDTNGTET